MAPCPPASKSLCAPAVRGEVDELRRFVDRRISELSMEIHATVQLVDYSETNLSARLASIHEQIAKIVAPPVAATYNSGVELEAVVQATENAANQIMEAAEAIGTWLQAGGDPATLSAVTEQVNAIFEACTFQDLTGQRIRRAIEHLQQVETMLSGMMQGDRLPDARRLSPSRPDLVQTDIDSMFGLNPAGDLRDKLPAHCLGEFLVALHRDHKCSRPADHPLPVISLEFRLQRQDRQAVDDHACLNRLVARLLGRPAAIVRPIPGYVDDQPLTLEGADAIISRA